MNVFVLHRDPVKCARAHCDKHVVKMILETAQLLSTAHHELSPARVPVGIYKSTHRNHPCAIWCRATSGNYQWLYELGVALCDEYTHRYGKVHKTAAVLAVLRKLPRGIQHGARTRWPLAMPDECKVSTSAVRSYRQYYREAKARILSYTNRQPPRWLRGTL